MLMYIADENGEMHEITAADLRAPLQVQRMHTPSSAANIRIISRSESVPNAVNKTKLRTMATPVKSIITRRNTAPAVTSQHLAHRFRQNWLAKFPMDTCSNGSMNLDDSLTSLNWLQNLNIMKMATPSAPTPVQTIPFTKDSKVNPNAVLNVVTTPVVKYDQRYPTETRIVSPPVSSYDKIDYKTNHTVKPSYSYATLICMAMQETKKQKITLSSIYNWITDNFVYYRMAEPSWQNSIRHNLSLNKCFQKVPRRKDEPGKGGFWRINPEYVDSFENGVFKKRRCSNERFLSVPMPPLKRIKREMDDDIFSQSQDSCGSKENTSNPFMNFNMVQSDDEGDSFSGEINWSNILSQDISIEGKTIKTEDLLNETEALASPLMEMSPPPSESSNSDDLGLDELLTDFVQDVALDFTTNDPLDLTVSGRSLKAPNWWGDSFGFGDQSELIEAAESATAGDSFNNSGLHTPVAQSPAYESDGLGWETHDLSAFDVDNLFDIDNLPDPVL